jgi:hypothetical protein
MGAWGYGIRQDDTVCDVIDAFDDALKSGKTVADATKAVRGQFTEALDDSDDGPLLWIALADAQWSYGQLDPVILKRVKDDLGSGASLARWDEDGEKGLHRRRAVLERFIKKIEARNPRPKKPPKVVIRKPKFEPDDCLCIRLSNGQYGAALVLAADHSDAEYGKNLVAALDYMSKTKPSLKMFQQRKWLHLTHHSWNEVDLRWYLHVGFRALKERLEWIGRIELRDSDPKDCPSYFVWKFLGEQIILQRKWDAKKRKK